MKKLLPLLASLMLGSSAFGSCYELSLKENQWSRSPELLCMSESESGTTKFELYSNVDGEKSDKIAEFNLNLLYQARCIDCNESAYGTLNPENSVFSNLQVKFNGQLTQSFEFGKLELAGRKLFYRSYDLAK